MALRTRVNIVYLHVIAYRGSLIHTYIDHDCINIVGGVLCQAGSVCFTYDIKTL